MSGSLLKQGNRALRTKDYPVAIDLYRQALARQPGLASIIAANLRFAERKQRQQAGIQEQVKKHKKKKASLYQHQLEMLLREAVPLAITDTIGATAQAIDRLLAETSYCVQPPQLVSVIMPTHNRAAVIGEAITTVVEQRYAHWQLIVCDDASTDDTAAVVAEFHDPRIEYLPLPKRGAAAARNAGLQHARGEIIAYLDSDNFWHPDYLAIVAAMLRKHPGCSAIYADDITCYYSQENAPHIEGFRGGPFDAERLLQSNFIDLNSFAHRRELYACFGGFDEALPRLQDQALIIKYTWLRDPLHFPYPVNLYRRDPGLHQIANGCGKDSAAVQVKQTTEHYFRQGLPRRRAHRVKKLSILSWDHCRNHHSKPFALAEALADEYAVQLVSFDFFNEGLFVPLRDVNPHFATWSCPGKTFPGFFKVLDKALDALNGDLLYVVKPRLPSLGLALLANRSTGVPIALEINDMETIVSRPGQAVQHLQLPLEAVNWSDPELRNPYSERWAQVLDPIAQELPMVLTHNTALDAHFGNRCLYMRNIKDESIYDIHRYDRSAIRRQLGFRADDRVILFGGLLRAHKGVYELLEMIEHLGDARYQLLFVASQASPEQARIAELARSSDKRLRLLPPQNREGMARINLAADIVILWLNPDIPASHYQMPYKATDALAMGTPIIANAISDFAELGRQGYLRLVPYGDWAGMRATLNTIFADPIARQRQIDAGRRLFQRQFSYMAARSNLDLSLFRVRNDTKGVLPVAERFGAAFDRFRAQAPPK
ncbi:glycosyltransferase [Rhabdochromatium marinum]|uniref:glycosyltransferase n=1 Tax=Rhabdochromatium marinum TaxID=48729 RepID=UPI00190402DB|nr:glycosyltransferase [Rhabdochromatium marinum]MBK1649517.1 hypothetical protein [Rhabdochromatium marinum]